jgi:hypothetical protein
MLNENPLEHISNTLEIESVFVKGNRILNPTRPDKQKP